MITGEQIQECWKAPIPAKKKLDWHEPWRDNSKFIDVKIIGFRVERDWLKVYYSWTSPHFEGERFDLDIAEQFKLY